MKSKTTAPIGHEKQTHKSFLINRFTLRPALWLLCCALPMWLGAQVPQGTFSGNTICPGGQATLTFTATLGTEPYTVRYTDGNATRTQPGVMSGVPFNAVSNTTATKTYTLLRVTGADFAVRSNGFTDATGTVTVSPRPNLQSLTLAPIAPVCSGSDATLKINGFVKAQSFETQAAISTSADAAQSVYAADLDGDGDLDVLSASSIDKKIAWYKNDGNGGFTAQLAISTTAEDPYSVYAADLDGDGALDVLSASEDDDKIAWYKNNGSGVFTEQTAISTTANGARSVYAADLDGDGNMDVLSASFNDNKIAWYKNNGFGGFTEQTAISTTAEFATSVYAADLDGDGDLDVLSASSPSKIAWYKNDGSGVFTPQTDISTTADAAQSVYAADLDGDGDLDVLSASYNDHKIAWYKNNGSGVFTPQTAITTSALGAFSVYAADLDGDGDLDVLSASFFDDKIAWYQNNGSGAFAAQTDISTSADGARSVYAADLDGDGNLDVLSASALDDKIAWYKGRTPFNGNATVTYTAGGGEPQTAIAPVSAGMAIYTLPTPKAGTLNALISATAGGCATSASESANLTLLPRPDLQDLTLAPISPVCPGTDATLKLNGFVQAQSFETQTTISTTADDAFSVYTADLDGDGDLDVLSASYNDNKIAWYKNNGSGGLSSETIISTSAVGAFSVYAADLDGDGDLDVLSASSVDNKIAWYKNNGNGGFSTELTISTSADGAHSVYAADLDGDGNLDVLSAAFNAGVAWYKNDGNGGFTAYSINNNSLNDAYSVYAADLDDDGDMDILSAFEGTDKIVWYKNNGSGGFTEYTISTLTDGAQSAYAADLDGDGYLDVLSASFNDDKIAWYKNDGSGGFGPQMVISNASDFPTSVYAADLDSDGDLDVLSASFLGPLNIGWYKNDGNGGFVTQTALEGFNNGYGAKSVYAADLDGDGDLDVLSAIYQFDKIAWYENRTPFSGSATMTYTAGGGEPQTTTAPVSAGMATFTLPDPKAGSLTVFKVSTADGCTTGSGKTTQLRHLPRPDLQSLTLAPIAPVCSGSDATLKLNGFVQARSFEAQPPITTLTNGAISVYSADLDGDGDLDVLSASVSDDEVAWYQNDGSGGFGPQIIISKLADFPASVYAADLDGDGDMDVLSASFYDDKIAFYKNNGSGGFDPQTVISNAADGAFSVYAADLDGDGDLDVLSASNNDNKIAWYENKGSSGFGLQTVISTAVNGVQSVYATDLDGDGDMDVLSASFLDNKIAWYENNGSGGFGAQSIISTAANGAAFVTAADLDGDSDMDVLSASQLDNKVAWYQNDGSGGFGAQNIISTSAGGTASVHAADLDGDGDLDVLSASGQDNKVAWYENNGSGSFGSQTVISNTTGFASSVYAADLDGDGDLDVPVAAYHGDRIEWFENRTPFSGSASVMYDINSGTPQTASSAVNMGMASLTIPVTVSGTLTVTKVTNADGCSTTVSKATPVTLSAPPTFTACPTNKTAFTSANACTAVVDYIATADGDPASVITYALTGLTTGSGAGTGSGTAFNKGVTTVTLTATNDCGAPTCQFTVTVTDNVKPIIACPANRTVNTDQDLCSSVQTYDVTTTDNCSASTTQTSGLSSGAAFPVGTTTNGFTATDAAGNTSACAFAVTVVDNQKPVIACPANRTVNADQDLCSSVQTYDVTTTDNCSASTTQTSGLSSGTAFPVGTTTNGFTATDAAGNTSACAFTVTVVDNQKPVIACPANRTVNADQGQCSSVQSYTVTTTDNCSASTQPTAGLSTGAAFPVGTTINAFLATDAAGNTSTCSFSIRVLDTQLPVVSCPANTTLGIGDNCSTPLASYGLATKSDNCSTAIFETQSPVAGTVVTGHNTAQTVTLTATDASGNSAACSFIVTLKDVMAPSITCPANIIRPTDLNVCSAVVTYATPIYSDNCSGGGAVHINGGTSGSTFPKGISTVNWQATDGVGLTKTCSFTITVTDGQAPTITCPANIVRSNDAGLCNSSVAYPTPTASDNCGLPTGQPQWVSGGTAPTASGANSTATFQKGATVVTWRATDGVGLTKTCTFRVTVNDTEAPTMTCPAAMSLSTATNTCSAVVTYTNPTFTDNCAPTSGTATRISGFVSGSTFPVGNSNVVFQATDAAGNTRRCTMVVTVTDNQAPVITCPTPVVVNGSGTPCNATVFYGNATASDNCTPALTPFLVSGLASGSVFPVGVTNNTFRAVAPNGQSSECSFAVTVNCGNGMSNNGVEVRDADLSVQHSDKLDLKLAPNPALSTVTVSIEGVGANGGTLLVFDAVGRLILRQVVAENQRIAVFQVDGADFAPGLYRVNLRTETGMVTKTLVVVK